MPITLPVDAILPSVLDSVGRLPITLVEAPPGSGKTTRVPPYLSSNLPNSKRLLLLQPRRIAVQSVAVRIADEQGVKLGGEVGYAVRFESKFNAATKLLVCTEGILRRMLTDDVSLDGVSTIVFDEFHERSLDSDLLLSMCRNLQATLRPDLKIVIMSATIASEAIKSRITEAAIHRADGTMFPVDVRYQPANARDRLPDHVADVVCEAVQRHEGDVLVFLPGKGEIYQTQNVLSTRLPPTIEISPLHGTMTLEQQRVAIETSDHRRVILATNIAETSLTIEGIRVVIDSGLARVMRFDPDTGLDKLMLEPICRASADQRAGRAGRVAPGVAYRLWSTSSHQARSEYLDPEIYRVDFAAALLQLLMWGERDVQGLPWLDAPTNISLQSAEQLLSSLGALHAGKLSADGKILANIPVHPRTAKIVLEAWRNNVGTEGCLAAALLSERDPFMSSASPSRSTGTFRKNQGAFRDTRPYTKEPFRWSCDVWERIEAIEKYRAGGNPITKFGEIHRNSLMQIEKVAQQIAADFSKAATEASLTKSEEYDDEPELAMRRAFLAAYPDRVARRRDKGKDRALMVGGKGVRLSADSGVVNSDFFVCLDVDGRGTDATVRKASAIEREWLQGSNLRIVDEMFYSPTHAAVQCRRRTYWLDLCLEESPTLIKDQEAASDILLAAAISDWKRCFPENDRVVINLIGRIRLLANVCPDLNMPQIDQSFLHEVCRQICRCSTSLNDVKSADWESSIRGALTGEQAAALARLMPIKCKVAAGREVPIDYTQEQPILALRIQDAFGMTQNPRVADGKIVVQLHLLAPNQRPQQITNDLASFWRNGYPIVRKELKRRYSKHAWPEDPIAGE